VGTVTGMEEPPIEREDVVTIMRSLMRAQAKLDRVLELLGDEYEEEEEEEEP
jgi:hypothetical protein